MAVVLHRGEKTRTVEPFAGERLLYCGLRHGLPLPYECGTGTCGTCKAVLESGELDLAWPKAPGLRYVKPQRREHLLCQSAALTDDVHIRVRAAPRFPIPLPVPQYFSGEIRNQRFLNADVTEFELAIDADIEYLPGQFVALEHPGIPGYRAYSMTSGYDRDSGALKFVVKRVSDGSFTNWLFEHVRDGARLAGFGPMGRAVALPEGETEIAALAGGTGIAGIMAILDWAVHAGHLRDARMRLVFGLNSMRDIFFASLLDSLSAQWSNLSVCVALVDDSDEGRMKANFKNIEFEKGYLHEVAHKRLPDLSDTSTVFVAGPPPAVDASLKMLVTQKKIPASKIRYDKFA